MTDPNLPCKLCGGQAVITTGYWFEGTWHGSKVRCTNPDCTIVVYPERRVGAPDALTQWNRRNPTLPREDGAWIIVFEDADREDETFVGFGAREAAFKRYEQVTVSWNAHLFERIRSALPPGPYSGRPALSAVRVDPEPVAWQKPTEVPDVKPGESAYRIVAVRRAHSGKVYSLAAFYLNQVSLFFEDDMEDRIITGWNSDEEGDDGPLYRPLLGPGDELMGWRDFPVFHDAPTQEPGQGEVKG